MSQNLNYVSKNIITQGYQIGTGVKLVKNTLILNPYLEGVAGTTWIFETPNNELVILSFYWGVRPNAVPKIDKEYKRSIHKSNLTLNTNVEYTTHSNNYENETWTHLSGYIDEEFKIDIKRKYPYWTNIKDTDFVDLLNKYHLEIIEFK